ncbi:hypothetical protein PHYSODRAFT_466190, partial [Phytophthora sojae]
MVERRLKCSSKTCSGFGVCSAIWKVDECTDQDKWRILVNSNGHSQGVLRPMKTFIAAQDEAGLPPRVILVNIKKQADIKPSSGGWPELSQIQNASKRIRREQGAKNSIKSIHKLAR